MAEIRSVSVHLDADVASYIAKMRLAGAETDKAFGSLDQERLGTLNRQLTGTATRLDKVATSASKVSTETRKVDTEITRLGNDVDRTRVKVDNGGRSIDRYSGRLGLLVSGLTAVGPAAVPIGAVAVPAVSALGSGLAFAAAGAGTFVLAFHNVGGALTAINKAQLEPTKENLQAAHEAMAKLPPDARAFVLELNGLRPEVLQLQAAAGKGLFPGLTDGLHALQSDGPLAERVLRNIGGELGHLGSQAGHALASDQWRPFLRFVGREAPRELNILGHATGSVTHGLAELWMAMSPLNRDVDHGILNLAQDFDRWATNLDKTKDFQSFLQYVETNGPRVTALLGDTANLFVDIVKAAAPLGGPTLQALDLIVQVLDGIANSPLGTPLLLLLQINSVLKLTGSALGAVGVDAKIGFGGVSTGAKEGSASVRALKADILSTGTALRTIGGNARRYTTSGTTLFAGVSDEQKSNLKQGAALAGGLAFAMSGADQSMGLTNTTALALAGSLGGPVGAGLGAAAGLALDYKASIDADRQSMEDFQTQLDELVRGDKVAALQELSDRLNAARERGKGSLVGGVLDDLSGRTDEALARTKRRVDDLTHSQYETAAAAGDFGRAEQIAARRTLAMRAAAKQTSDQFLAFGDDLDDAKVSLDKWIRSLAQQADDLENFGNNAKRAADKGLRDGLIKQLEAAGPAGARRMRQLADATQSEIARANHAWDSGRHAANDYQEAVAYVANHPPTLTINGVPQSIHQIRLVEEALRAIHDKVVNVTVQRHAGGRVLPGSADGGTVPGPRAPYGDHVLMPVAAGEEIITNRHGQADMNRGALKAANRGARLAIVGGMAGGGTVSSYRGPGAPVVATSSRFERSSERVVERIVERLPDSVVLTIDGRKFRAYVSGVAQGNYEANQDHERAMSGG